MGACSNDHLKTPSRHTAITPIRSDISDTRNERHWPSWKHHYINGNNDNNGYFIQISDIHLDLQYETGSLARCDQLLCCRTTSNASLLSHDKGTIIDDDIAGPWGHYLCDV